MSDIPPSWGTPYPGQSVWYQTDGRNYDYFVPAIVRITRENLVPQAVEDGAIEDLDSDLHVHLWVTGGKEPYAEMNVPLDYQGSRRSWRPIPRQRTER